MAKAIAGAAMIGAAVGFEFFSWGMAMPFLTLAMQNSLVASLFMGGASMEIGAIADALSQNRSQGITTRQPAAYRGIIYGTRQVPGVMVYQSTTGSNYDQYNMVIVLAGHPCWAIQNLYLDGRKVFWETGSTGNIGPGGNTTTNGLVTAGAPSSIAANPNGGFNFGGQANSNTYIGPNGAHYNFGTLVYCEARLGWQSLGEVIGGLTANDPNWATGTNGSPSLVECTYVYLKIEYDTNMFSQFPEIRFTMSGNCDIYDPRTTTYGFSENWALCVSDVLTNTAYGLGVPQTAINTAQLIAAANVCDEQITLAATGTESQYTCNWIGDTMSTTGDILSQILPAGGGSLAGISCIGGQWYIWPAYWQGTTFAFDQTNLIDPQGPLSWKPYRSFRDLFNRVKGTYIAPFYPYAVAGNLYDENGWYDGTIANTFNLGWQPNDYPYYAQDVLHGYSSDQWLTEDGRIIYKDLNHAACISIATAQRIGKMTLLRNRFQATGTLNMGLEGLQLQPKDVFYFDFPAWGWNDVLLEVVGFRWVLKKADGAGDDDPLALCVEVDVQVTDPTIYEWSASEELSIYDVPVTTISIPYVVAPPTSMVLDSSAATAIVAADGTVTPRVLVTWNAPLDISVTQIDVQYQPAGASSWIDTGTVNVGLFQTYVSNVVANSLYNFRIRSVRATGATSVWEEIDGYTVSLVLSVTSYSGIAQAQAALAAIALVGGTANIQIANFTATYGGTSVACTPSPSTLTGLLQGTLYYVYYIDLTFVGGTVTPIATQSTSSFLGVPGYILVGSITTPNYAPLYRPTTYADAGAMGTAFPAYAYDGNISTDAMVQGQWFTAGSGGGVTYPAQAGNCIFSGFSATTLTASATLSVIATPLQRSGSLTGTQLAMSVGVYLAGVLQSTMGSWTAGGTTTTYTWTVPSGTNLSQLTVVVQAAATAPSGYSGTGGASGGAQLQIAEIWIQ